MNPIGSQVTYNGQTWTIFCYCGGVTPDQVQYVWLNQGGTFTVAPVSAISTVTYSGPFITATSLAGYFVVIGMSFTPTVAGTINAVWAYVAGGNSGSVSVGLYSSTGTLLGTGTAPAGPLNAWQSVPLSTPVAVTAGTTYVSAFVNSSSGAVIMNATAADPVAPPQFTIGSYLWYNSSDTLTFPTSTQGAPVIPAPVTIVTTSGGAIPGPDTGTVSATLGTVANIPNIDGAAQNFNDAGTSVAANLTTTQANDVVFVCLESGATTTGVSGGGLTWTQIASTTNSGGTICQVYQAIAPTPLANVAISVTYAASTAVWMGIVAVSNANTTTPLDGSVVIQNTKGGALNVTTTLANDIVFAFSNHDIDMNPAPAAGWTAVLGNTNKWALVQYQIVPTASTVNAQGADPLDANGSMAWAVKHA